MKDRIISISPEIEDGLTIARDASNIGQGAKDPQSIEDFTDAVLNAALAPYAAIPERKKREELHAIIAAADSAKLDAIQAAVSDVAAEPSPVVIAHP